MVPVLLSPQVAGIQPKQQTALPLLQVAELDRFVESFLEPSYADVAAPDPITFPEPSSTVEDAVQSPEAQLSDPDLAVFCQGLLRHSTDPSRSTLQLQAGPGLDAMLTKEGSSHRLPSRQAHASSSLEAARIRGLGSHQARPEESQADRSLDTNVAQQGSHLQFPLIHAPVAPASEAAMTQCDIGPASHSQAVSILDASLASPSCAFWLPCSGPEGNRPFEVHSHSEARHVAKQRASASSLEQYWTTFPSNKRQRRSLRRDQPNDPLSGPANVNLETPHQTVSTDSLGYQYLILAG